jgi:LysM repeat protein
LLVLLQAGGCSMSADFGRPQGVLTSVLAVLALVLGGAGLFFGLSASKMKTQLNERIAAMEENITAASQQAQAANTQLRQLDVSTQRALITLGTKMQMMDAKLTPPTNATVTATAVTHGPTGAGTPPAAGTARVATATAAGTYVIKSGDTLGKVAVKHGTTSDALIKLNPGLDPRRLKVGTQIKVPAAATR